MSLLMEMVGESPGIAAVRERIARLVARASTVRRLPPVLIQGETGSGKGLVARSLHKAGPRAAGPFVDINCAAIPETLLEAEMFGFERGAFTDARQAKRGLFQAAHRGTLFLDEIGLLPEGLQAKLLTVLEERTVRRLGATHSEPVDVWVIAATNLDLQAATQAGRFREDLYHRLAVLTLTLPPLRERPGDAVLLAEHFLARACADYGLVPKTLAPDARAALVAYRWPGNIRELMNTMERVALLTEAPVVTADVLGLPAGGPARPGAVGAPEAAPPTTLAAVVDTAERRHLQEALEATGWNISRAAARLSISRNTIRYRIEKHGLRPGAPAPPRRTRQAAEASIPGAAPSPPGALPGAWPATPPAPIAIRWERRRLAVLQARLSVDHGAGFLDAGRTIEILVDKVRSFGGRVEELGASGFLALFGLEPVEDAVRRAALAAVAMQRAALQAPDGPRLGIRVGIDLGSLLLSRIHGASLVDTEDKQTALGALGALLEGSDAGSIIVSATAAPFLARGFDLAPVGLGPGRRSAFRLDGLERGEAAGGRLTRFVGRDHELDLLRSRLAAAVRGQGQVVAITGEAGIGKSRLVAELRRSLADRPVRCVEGHCLPYVAPIPCLPLVEILREVCGIVETDGPDGVRDKVRAMADRAGIDALEATPYLLHLLDPGEGGGALARLSPDVVKARTFETLRELSRRLADRMPLVLVVEDLHWVDRTSEEYLATLVDVVVGARILLVTTHRSGYRPLWMDKSYATQVALQPLSPEDSRSLVRDVIGGALVDEPTVEMIVAKTEGNPFFAEELVRAVTEGGPASGLAVPDTVEGVLMARIDRVGAEDKRVLQAAAVIGRSLPFLLLQAILDPRDEGLRERLTRLQDAEFLYETRAASELEYMFKHALTHEVTYASLLPGQRRALHARIVEVLEGWQREGREELVERLAHHAIQAEAWAKAVDYARRAGLQALARSAYRDAVTRFEQALGALGHLSSSPDTLAQDIDLRLDLRTVLTPLGDHRRILEHLREAERIAHGLDDQRRLGRISAYLADAHRLAGEHERAIDYGERALTIAERLGDFGLEIAANTYVGQICHTTGRYREGIAHLGRNVERLVGALSRETFGLPFLSSVHSRTWLTFCLTEVGEFATGIRIGEEGIRIAESADQPLSLASACQALGTLYVRMGDAAGAIPLLERARTLASAWNLGLWIPAVDSLLGSAYALAGRLEEAVPLLEEAVERQRAMRRMAFFALRVVGLGEAYLAIGRPDESAALAEQALAVARGQGERGSEAYALRLRADIVACSDPFSSERAHAAYREAAALAGDLGMEPLVALNGLGLARAWWRARQRSAAEEEFTLAAARFRKLGMRFWQAQVEGDLRLLS